MYIHDTIAHGLYCRIVYILCRYFFTVLRYFRGLYFPRDNIARDNLKHTPHFEVGKYEIFCSGSLIIGSIDKGIFIKLKIIMS